MNVNDFSLGWELANRNDGREPYTEMQYRALTTLAVHYTLQGIPLDAFVSHAEVALPQGRKSDPAGFQWARFYENVRRHLTPGLVPLAVQR
jgi:N-acetyl-anhydromuramyl-L-alanine amidase AmpD